MTERSPAERPTACPFLAFDEDRDFRADRPDHRHRCFAEARPAPRAISHQELFCLGGSFADCPTFAAWAVREAAAVRRPTIRQPEPVRGVGSSSPARPAPSAASVAAAGAVGAAGSGDRDWLAPPPWAAGGPSASGTTSMEPDGEPTIGWDDEPPPVSRAQYPQGDDVTASPDPGETPPFLAGRARPATPSPAADRDDDLAGLVGGAALIGGVAAVSGAGASAPGLAGPVSGPAPASARPPAQPVSGRASGPPPAGYTSSAAAAAAAGPDSLWIHPDSLDPGDDVDWEEAVDAAAAARVARSRRDDGRGGRGSRFGLGRSRPATSGQARPLPDRAADPSAPAWERPRHFDSYPAIKARRGASGIPRIAIWAGLLLAAALVLFFVPPLFLGGGGGTTASPTPSASTRASVAPSPTATIAPSPTPFTYTVKAGDTLSRIAGKYKVAVADILAVNPDMKNPDRLQIGQKIVIPLPVSSIIPDAGTPTATTAP